MKLVLLSFLFFLIASCRQPPTLFKMISSSHSNITFNNKIIENDSINPLDMEFLYNGGGVAVGDFNNDSLPDLYFTGSQQANKLYINKDELKFEDVTEQAFVNGAGRWCNAASVVDINNDGWDDIYVCATVKKNYAQRTNLLYINQGLDKKGAPFFKEMAQEYNLADSGFSVHAAFFDYDGDGDLDMYLVTTALAQRNSTRFDGTSTENKEALSDKLYSNEGSDSLGHPYFKDVSKEAGISDEGYGLGIAITDINKDGWKDIYVTNDFYGNDLLYINNGNGTFTDNARICLKHTSQNAMGIDVADINNDGLEDIIAVDMNPEDNYRKKKNMNGANYFVHQSIVDNGVAQYVRNTLQLNNGAHLFDTTKPPLPSFSDIAFYAGVAETDWSWNPSLVDFDNDGFKDLFITNGYPRDVTDHDFGAFRLRAVQSASKKELLDQIPQIKIANYVYQNTGTLKFNNVAKEWGMDQPSFSTGAVYVDLDRDGDMDYVINNINDEAFVYENRSEVFSKNHYLNIRFKGSAANLNGIGVHAQIYYGTARQSFENAPYRGYLSTVEDVLHFGIGKNTSVDSIIIKWPDGKQQVLRNVSADQTLLVSYLDAVEPMQFLQIIDSNALFANTTARSNIFFRHYEFDYVDFDYQKLLPHKLSQFGPSIAVSDIDNNGLDDVFVGASAGNYANYFLQQANGKFSQKELPQAKGKDARQPEMMGSLLFDADEDGDLDLFTSSGSNEFVRNSKSYQDQFYTNTGSGIFVHDSAALPQNYTSKSCVKGADFDGDGDLDLFIGGRIDPGRYPAPVNSFIYRNDSKKGQIKFTDVTNAVAPSLNMIGLVCDAVWTDFDNDGWQDLILAGEWMPITFLKNKKGIFTNITASTSLQEKRGWWTSIASGDFDNDGDLDYVAGNLGLNSFFKASDKEPVRIYAADFDDDPSFDAIPTLYLKDATGNKKEYPAHVRDDMIKQMISTRRKFPTYKSFAEADIDALLTKEQQQKAQVFTANLLASCYLQNNGSKGFELKPLPALAQLAPLNGMVVEDVNGDGFLDLIINGNDFGNEVVNGRYDALNGLVLLGDGKGGFTPLSFQNSGFYIPGDAKGLASLIINGKYSVAATQNRNMLQLFSMNKSNKNLRLNNDDVFATIYLKNGKRRKIEFAYGNSFLSQSAKFIKIDDMMQSIDITNRMGKIRKADALLFKTSTEETR